MKLTTSNYNLFFIFFSIIWIPLQRFYLHVDGAGRILLLLSIIALFLNFNTFVNRRELFRSSAFIIWTLLVLFSMFNSFIKGFKAEWGAFEFIRTNFINPLVFLIIAIIEFNNNKYRCLYTVLAAQIMFLLMGAMHASSLDGERVMAEELGNSLPLMAAGCSFVVSVLFCENRLKGGWGTYILILVFILGIILLAATRKALGAVLIVLIGMVLTRIGKISLRSILTVLLAAIVLFGGVNYILGHSLIGERITASAEIFDVPLVKNEAINKALMIILGDRATQYYLGIQLFHEHPVTGIGLTNFMGITDYGIRLHSEYMVQLCENGIIGFLVLLVFYSVLLKGIKKKRKSGNNMTIYLFGLLMVLFLNITVWTYNMQIVMVVYALVISQIYSNSIVYENSHPRA